MAPGMTRRPGYVHGLRRVDSACERPDRRDPPIQDADVALDGAASGQQNPPVLQDSIVVENHVGSDG